MKILPAEPLTDSSLTVTDLPWGAQTVTVAPLGIAGGQPFVVSVAGEGSLATAHFSVGLPGRYEVRVGGERLEFGVAPYRALSFGVEFGVLSTAVALLFGGMILWARKRRGVGSASSYGRF